MPPKTTNILQKIRNQGIFHKVSGQLDPISSQKLRLASKAHRALVNNSSIKAHARAAANAIVRSPVSAEARDYILALRIARRLSVKLGALKKKNFNYIQYPVPQLVREAIAEENAGPNMLKRVVARTQIYEGKEFLWQVSVQLKKITVDYAINVDGRRGDPLIKKELVLHFQDAGSWSIIINQIYFNAPNLHYSKIMIKPNLSLNELAKAVRDTVAIKREMAKTFGVHTSIGVQKGWPEESVPSIQESRDSRPVNQELEFFRLAALAASIARPLRSN
jgi:hypothetical protein